jgi:hypothetical protein
MADVTSDMSEEESMTMTTSAEDAEDAAAADITGPIAFPFRRGGFQHTLLAREGAVCLVGRGPGSDPDGFAHYEIVVLRPRAAHVAPDGRIIPAACEAYPSSSAWGQSGWSYVHWDKAEKWYRVICRRQQRSRTPAESLERAPV